MDTSDSEHFESADEEIFEDSDEPTQIETPKDVTVEEKSINLDVEKKIVEEENKENEILQDSEDKINQLSDKVEKVVEISDDLEENSDKTKNVQGVDKSEPKKSRSSNKLKLGCKIAKDSVKFEATPEKKPDITEKAKSTLIEDENMWGDEELDWGVENRIEQSKQDTTQKYSSPNKPEEKAQSDNWGGWGSWGVSVLSTATQSVTSITSQITNVIESGLGAVDPEEMAKINLEEKKKLKEAPQDHEPSPAEDVSGVFGLGSLVKLVENTGNKVLSGGLDTLETIGKKTMEVLQEGDPGLKKKRAFLKIDQDKPVLSQILREAKEKAEREGMNPEKPKAKKTKNYETMFDDHHGLVHLEALELLSKQCEIKLKTTQDSLGGASYTEFVETMDQIKELCELPEEEEEISLAEVYSRLQKSLGEMHLGNDQISFDKMIEHWKDTEAWIDDLDVEALDEGDLHQKAIETLAQITSMAMEQFHKVAELLLIQSQRKSADEAVNLAEITTTLTSLIGIVAAKFSEKLNGKVADSSNKETSELITNIFFEAANSSSYVQDALQLLIPVVQVGAI